PYVLRYSLRDRASCARGDAAHDERRRCQTGRARGSPREGRTTAPDVVESTVARAAASLLVAGASSQTLAVRDAQGHSAQRRGSPPRIARRDTPVPAWKAADSALVPTRIRDSHAREGHRPSADSGRARPREHSVDGAVRA